MTKRKKATAAADLMLAPWVIVMRMPLLMLEGSRNPWRRAVELEKAVVEKAAAAFESAGVAQAELAQASIRAWGDMANGRAFDHAGMLNAWSDLADAAMAPAARRVRANYRRLSKR